VRRATGLLARAEKLAGSGKLGQAYRSALSAWEQVGPHAKDDPECQKMAGIALARLKQYGEAANHRIDTRKAVDRPLSTR